MRESRISGASTELAELGHAASNKVRQAENMALLMRLLCGIHIGLPSEPFTLDVREIIGYHFFIMSGNGRFCRCSLIFS
jgi:hypothetical protein